MMKMRNSVASGRRVKRVEIINYLCKIDDGLALQSNSVKMMHMNEINGFILSK